MEGGGEEGAKHACFPMLRYCNAAAISISGIGPAAISAAATSASATIAFRTMPRSSSYLIMRCVACGRADMRTVAGGAHYYRSDHERHDRLDDLRVVTLLDFHL